MSADRARMDIRASGTPFNQFAWNAKGRGRPQNREADRGSGNESLTIVAAQGDRERQRTPCPDVAQRQQNAWVTFLEARKNCAGMVQR